MNNCLVTQLKGIVNDPSLSKLGVAEIKFKITNSSMKGLSIYLHEETRVTTDKNVQVFNDGGTQLYPSGKDFTLPVSGSAMFIKPDSINDVVVVSFYNKYTSVYILGSPGANTASQQPLESCHFTEDLNEYLDGGSGILDVSVFKESALQRLNVDSADTIFGDLSSLYGKEFKTALYLRTSDYSKNEVTGNIGSLLSGASDTLKDVSINAPGLVGDIADVGSLPMNVLRLSRTGVTGSLESFCEAWYNRGQANCFFEISAKNITLNGSPLGSGDVWYGEANLANGLLEISDFNNVIATYNGNTWSY